MRKNSVKRSAMLNVARIITLVMIFAVAFAIAMTAGNGGLFNIASAAVIEGGGDVTTELTLGATTGAIQGTNGNLGATNFSFPGTTASTTSWKFEEPLSKIALTQSTHELYRTASSKTVLFSNSDTAGRIYFGIRNAVAANNYMMIMRYQLSPFMNNLLNAGYTIDAQITATLHASDHWDSWMASKIDHTYYAGAIATTSSGVWTAKKAYEERDNATYFKNVTSTFNATDQSIGSITSATATLTKTNNTLSFSFGSWFGKRNTQERECSMKLTDIKIIFTIKYPSSYPTSVDDGGAPIKVRDFYSSGTELYSPKVTAASGMPVYYSSLKDEYTNAFDKADSNGNWTLNSYTSAKKTESLGSDNKSTEFYKSAKIEFADTYDYTYSTGGFNLTKYQNDTDSYRTYAGIGGYSYSTRWSADTSVDTNSNRFCGIKNVVLKAENAGGSNTTGNTISVSGLAVPTSVSSPTVSTRTNITISGNIVGYAVVKKYGRSRICLEIYMTTNAKVTVTVNDFGNRTCTSWTDFRGIDTTAPDASTNSGTNLSGIDGVISSDNESLASANWFRKNLFAPNASVQVTESTGSNTPGFSPYIWFFTAQKADSIEGLGDPIDFTGYRNLQNSSDAGYIYSYRTYMLPIAFGSISKFEYDFTTGKAKGYNSDTFNVVGNPMGSTAAERESMKGAGYYRFNFYIVDAAGNLGIRTSYLVKVDAETPSYIIDLSYIPDTDLDSVENILPSEFDFTQNPYVLKWATGHTTLQISVPVNLSGNTIKFAQNVALVFDRNSFIKVLQGNNVINCEGNKATISVDTSLGSTSIDISYALSESDGKTVGTFTFEFEDYNSQMLAYPNVALVTVFEIFTGQYADITSADNDPDKINWFDNAWGRNNNGEVHILIDRNIPDKPNVEYDGEELVTVEDNTNIQVGDKKWFTGGYTLNSKLDFTDNIADNNTYGSGVRVFYGISLITDMTQLAALQNKNIGTAYRGITQANASEYFDDFTIKSSGDLRAKFDIELLATSGSGMRVIYVWVVDQAGNVSDLSTYYILADANNYTVKSEIFKNPAFNVNDETITQGRLNESGTYTPATSFKRGDTIGFTIKIHQGYVPYLFTKSDGDGSVLVAENYSQLKTLNTSKNSFGALAQIISTPFASGDATSNDYVVQYSLDSDTFGRLDSTTTFTLSTRYVVTYTYAVTASTYSAKPVEITLSNFNNPDAESHFRFVFVNEDNQILYVKEDGSTTTNPDEAKVENDEPVLFVPVNAGLYNLRIFIPKSDDTYVTDDYDFDEETGEQLFPMETYAINKGTVTVTPTATSSVYGDRIVLGYTYTVTNNVDIENGSEKLVGSLKLDRSDWDPMMLLPVGSAYVIIQDTKFEVSSNFDIDFIENVLHTVTERNVEIVAWNESKVYGDDDEDFRFGVAKSQFAWYTDRGGEYTLESVLRQAFAPSYYTSFGEDGTGNYSLYYSGGRLTREEGESVGTYNFVQPNKDLFETDRNFTISVRIDTENTKFTIKQRNVVLNVSGQSIVVAQGQIPEDTSSIKPSYEIADKDMRLKEEIDRLIDGKLSISRDPISTGGAPVPPQYSDMVWYQIILGDTANENIAFTLGDDTVFIIYVAGGDAVIIGLKGGAVISVPFGTIWTDELITWDKFADKFEVTGIDAEEFDEIRWSFTLGGADKNSVISVGGHQVTLSDIELYKNNSKVCDAFASTFSISVVQSIIVVRPTVRPDAYQAYYKVYGDSDNVYGIGFEISHILMGDERIEINGDSIFADYSYQDLLAIVRGSYGRGVYDVNGGLRNQGMIYDSVTDENGFVYGSTDYYSFCVSTTFSSLDNNFNVQSEHNHDARFYISPKAVDLDLSNFVGVNKTYDETTDVYFGSTIAYDISSQLARVQDDLSLTFSAEYTTAGSLNSATDAGIIFTDFKLVGDSVHNYTLGTLTNSNPEGELLAPDGTNVNRTPIIEGVSVTIYYIDNINNESHIRIYMGRVGVIKSNFTVTKVYDNTTVLNMSAISIEESEDSDGFGTKVLFNIWQAGRAELMDEINYRDKDVSNAYAFGLLKIFFPIEGASGLEIADEGIYAPNVSGVTVYADNYLGRDGIVVEIRNISASITHRIINADSFESITTVDRDYNSRGRVETEVIFKDGVLAVGDTAASVGLHLMAQISDGEEGAENHIRYGHGTHTVSFTELRENPESSASDYTFINDRNYTVDIEDLNKAYSGVKALEVTIAKAKLTPNVEFLDKDYDGTANVRTEHGTYTGALTVLAYAMDLAEELEALGIKDGTAPTYSLSANGEINANVMVDANEQVKAHNVMVSGLTIVENGDKEYLRNYEIYGKVFANGQYGAVDGGNIKNGETVSDYEIIDAMTVNRKTLLILANNVNIAKKVYDGTRDADVTISLAGSGVAEGHEEHLMIVANGSFARDIVNNNVPVYISGVELVALDSIGREVRNNYLLRDYTERRSANILPRPVEVSANLGEKTYNGLAQISNNQLTFDLNGLIDIEAAGYAVQASAGAFFIDKNVAVDKDKNILSKPGTVYNPTLRNNRGKVNYVLVYRADKKAGDDYLAYVDINGTWHYDTYTGTQEVTYYYALPTADRYINKDSEEKLASAKDAIAGYYNLGGTGVYLVDSTYNGAVDGTLPEAFTYIKGEGKILQRSVAIASSGIVINENSTAFTKMYDGTKKFFGERFEEGKPNWDYRYTEGSIAGVIEGDEVEIETIFAEFDDAYTTANYVVFTPAGIKGKDADNYCIDGTVGSARIRGKIVKRTIDAVLKDGEMVYGSSFGSVEGELEYNVHGNGDKTYALDLWEGGFYLSYLNYTEMMGFDIGNYQDSLKSRMYTKNPNGGYDKVPESDKLQDNKEIYFVKLSGITALPGVKAVFPMSKPAAGTQAKSYTVENVDVNNYVFNPVYTKGDTSVLTVIRKDLFVATDGREYVKNYAGADPSVELFYIDKDGNHGFAPSETVVTVFRIDGVDYYPVVKFGLYNSETDKLTPMGKYPLISDELGPNERYVVYFEAPQGVDYAELIPNYNIYLGDKYFVDETNGNLIMKYGEFELKTNVSTLNLKLPEIAGISLRSAVDNVYNVTYNGTNLTSNVLLGIFRDGDEFYMENETDGKIAPVNAGIYNGYVNVARPIMIDANDLNGYSIKWTSAEPVTIVVGRASPGLEVYGGSKYYDGTAFRYGISGANNMVGSKVRILPEEADITYAVLKDGKFEEIDAQNGMIDAGTYRVTVTLNSLFADNNPNYAAESVSATYTVLRAIVQIKISTEGYVDNYSNNILHLGAVYEKDKNYVIDYSLSMPDAPESIRLTKEQTAIVFEKEITSSGRYPFAVEVVSGNENFNRDNYNLVNATGILELTTKFVSSDTGSVNLSEAIVANRFVAHTVIDGQGSSNDLDYWSKVNMYMPHIDSQASLAAVVRLALYYGSEVVDTRGTAVAVSVAIPEEIKNMDGIALYTVTAEGGLKRLTDYTVKDGHIEYTTDFLGALVFVDLNPELLPLWAVITISVVCALLGIAIVWTAVALVIRKKQLKQL